MKYGLVIKKFEEEGLVLEIGEKVTWESDLPDKGKYLNEKKWICDVNSWKGQDYFELVEETLIQRIMREEFNIEDGDIFNIDDSNCNPYSFKDSEIRDNDGDEFAIWYQSLLKDNLIIKKC